MSKYSEHYQVNPTDNSTKTEEIFECLDVLIVSIFCMCLITTFFGLLENTTNVGMLISIPTGIYIVARFLTHATKMDNK